MGVKKNDNNIIIKIIQLLGWLIISIILIVILAIVFSKLDLIIEKLTHNEESLIEAAVALIAAGLVTLELRAQAKNEKKENRIQECTFIEVYNRSFIENDQMIFIERQLERYYVQYCSLIESFYRLEGKKWVLNENMNEADIKNAINCIQQLENVKQDIKQKFGPVGCPHRSWLVNYLVYLEGLSTVVTEKIMDLGHIDSLFGYRFFICVNNPVVQELELAPYVIHYKNIFKLYNDWVEGKNDNYKEEDKSYTERRDMYGQYGVPMRKPNIINNGERWDDIDKKLKSTNLYKDGVKETYLDTDLDNLKEEMNLIKQTTDYPPKISVTEEVKKIYRRIVRIVEKEENDS